MEIDLLKSQNNQLKGTLQGKQPGQHSSVKNFQNQMKELGESGDSESLDNQYKSSEINNFSNILMKTDESEKSAISEDTQKYQDNSMNNLESYSPTKSPNISAKKNKYYKKYLHYKSLSKELQCQIQETKDRTIKSLVEKEKSLMKQKQEFRKSENEYRKKIEKLTSESCSSAAPSSSQTNVISKNFKDEYNKDFVSKFAESKEDFLKNEIREIKAERDNTVK